MGHGAKWEYFRAIYERYHKASRKLKHAILNEFCLNTGYHRKYAIRILNGAPPGKQPRPRRRRGLSYGHEVLSILTAVWEAAGYPWSVRLKALLPLWMPWIRKRFQVGKAMERQLLSISPRQMDRRLRAKKTAWRRRIYGRTKPGSLLKHHIPIKTDSWDVSSPGFTEVDLVSHSGNSGEGEFAHSLNVTDIHTAWTESRAVLGRGQGGVERALNEVESALPFRLLGLDSDNGSEFINWHLKTWCERKGVQLTRGRPYKKDDNAHIEQKNWTHVRKLLGWDRYDTAEAVEAMNDLYGNQLRLWLNLYLPSVKLVKKVRVGSKLRRVYDAAQTPLERVAASRQADRAKVDELKRLRQSLNPFALAKVIDQKLEKIYKLANRRQSPKAKELPLLKRNTIGRRNGCGNGARSASLEIAKRFPHFPSRDGGVSSPSVTLQMARRVYFPSHPRIQLRWIEIPSTKAEVTWKFAPGSHPLDCFWMNTKQVRCLLTIHRTLNLASFDLRPHIAQGNATNLSDLVWRCFHFECPSERTFATPATERNASWSDELDLTDLANGQGLIVKGKGKS